MPKEWLGGTKGGATAGEIAKPSTPGKGQQEQTKHREAGEAVKPSPSGKILSDSGRQSMQGPQPIGDRMPVNYEKAGTVYHFEDKKLRERRQLSKKYPEGVHFDSKGFPDFSPYAKESVKIQHMTGEPKDFTQANKRAGLAEKPDGFTWHHHQDCETMQLVPADLHRNVRHTGGRAILNAREYTQ